MRYICILINFRFQEPFQKIMNPWRENPQAIRKIKSVSCSLVGIFFPTRQAGCFFFFFFIFFLPIFCVVFCSLYKLVRFQGSIVLYLYQMNPLKLPTYFTPYLYRPGSPGTPLHFFGRQVFIFQAICIK